MMRMRAYASCDHLVVSSASAAERNDMLSIRQRRGKVVEVYDGRKWPVVRCGSVYVTAEDTAQKVTQTVVTATSVAEKKRRAGKYTVAVGTSHGHVQAFLEDADSVLAALDQCQAEEKCLMLIKRPKEAAKKMLKSHSWANLSVSDPQLYRTFNGLQLSQIQTAQHQLQKVKRSSDQQSVTSNDTDRSEPRRRYISARSKDGSRQGQRFVPDGTHQSVTSPDYYSDTSSAASDYQYVGRRAERGREQSRRGERYPSIPEDGQEINNNTTKGNNDDGKGNTMYYSCQDISYASNPPHVTGRRSRRQGQGQEYQGQGQIASDQLYHSQQQDREASTLDPGDMEDGSRSQSLGNLSTGLTLSLVGQRKADSMLDLSATRQPPPRSRGPRHRASDVPQYPDHVRSPRVSYPDSARSYRDSNPDSVRSPRESYPDSARSSRDAEPDNVFSPRDPRQFSYPDAQSPPYSHNGRSSGNYYTPISHQQGQPNGYAYSNTSSPREQTPLSDVPPPKPKRSLPQVPLVETSERIKRFTEMMRSRMSVTSSTGRSTANSQTSTTPQTPLSRQASVTENGSDCEVSTLLEVRRKGSEDSPDKLSDNGGRRPPDHADEDAAWREGPRDSRGGRYPHHQMRMRIASSPNGSSRNRTIAHETPQSYADHSSDGHTPFTSHSHSSTMDSGYTTNTEGDADSTVMSHVSSHFSPPHHMAHSHHHAPDTRAPPPRNLALATARKFSSMQNVSTTHHNGYNNHNYPPNPHHDVQNGDMNGNRQAPHYKGPGPVRAQHSMNGADVSTPDQRRSWDLAQSFKSLDFQPVSEADQSVVRRTSQEECLLKPQAVAVNGSVKHIKTCKPRRNDPQLQNGFDNRRSLPNGHGGNWQDPNSEMNGMSTLPGHWKYNTGSSHQKNINSNNTIQRSDSKPTPITTPPTLFQLSQVSELCSVKLSLPSDISVKDVLTLTSVQVNLPATPTSPGPLQLPQGRTAQLGGPGSAFRPVRSGPGVGQTVSVTGVGSVGEQCQQLCVVGGLQAGDVLVELNGWYCLNSDHLSVQRVLENCQGEVTLSIARKKNESIATRVKQLEQSLKCVESEVQRLTQEVAKKDSRILELSTMLPWKKERDDAKGEKVVLETEEGAFVIGDNEFVV